MPAYRGWTGKEAVKWLSVYVCLTKVERQLNGSYSGAHPERTCVICEDYTQPDVDKTRFVLEQSVCIILFGHNRNGPKIGEGLRPILGRGLGPYLTQSRLGRGLAPYQVTS